MSHFGTHGSIVPGQLWYKVVTTASGAGRMASYRLYCQDCAGHISLADWIEAETDVEALVKAREWRPNAHRCEIWLGRQLIAKLNAEGRLERVSP
jgi:hypothetical protein